MDWHNLFVFIYIVVIVALAWFLGFKIIVGFVLGIGFMFLALYKMRGFVKLLASIYDRYDKV